MSAPSTAEDSADRNVEIWKIKKLIKGLELARGFVILSLLYLLLKTAFIVSIYLHVAKTNYVMK